MERLVINGGYKLNGMIKVSGMKNSALPIIFATILVKDECIIEDIPLVSDVLNALEILREMAYNNMDKAIFQSIENTIEYLGDKRIQPDVLKLRRKLNGCID